MIKVRFICALLVAAAYYLREEWRNVKRGIRAAKNPTTSVPEELTKRRLEVCRKCALFYAPLQTCGSPLASDTWAYPNQPLGCFCQMEVKAKTQCNCWLYDETQGEHISQGWQGDLNSMPYGKQPVKD